MDSLLNIFSSVEPIIKDQATPLPQAKSPEVVSNRSLSRPGPRQHEPEKSPCPRCDSTNTKFCYYNNYNLSQPRHFCKSCRRYWTRGGALRNVPFGGGSRKTFSSNKRRCVATTTIHTTAAEDSAAVTRGNSNSLVVSCSGSGDVINQALAFVPVVSDPAPAPASRSPQSATVKSGGSICWWSSSAQMGILPMSEYGIELGPASSYEPLLNWPMEPVSGGNSDGVVVATGCSTWLMDGDQTD